MRLFSLPTRLLLMTALLALLVPVSTFAAQEAGNFPDAIGEVVSLMGNVTAEQPDGTTRQLELNKQVIPKDVIVTGGRSNVEIVFKDKSVFSQGADSRTALDDFVYSDNPSASKLLFKMGTGTFRYVTGQIVRQNPDAFALKTSTTTIGIRGTEVFTESTPEQEEIGVLDMTPGHQVDVSTPKERRTITKPGFSVRATPDGRLSEPSPTAPETRSRVMKAAPQTTQGELGSTPRSERDLDGKVEAFTAVIERTKTELGTIGDRPDYGSLHNLSLQTTGQASAESEREASTDSGLGGGEGGGDGGGGGGE